MTSPTGIAVLANDKVIKWLLPFLESHRITNAATPLYIIPYDDDLTLTAQAAARYGAHLITDDLSAIDSLARRLYPLQPGLPPGLATSRSRSKLLLRLWRHRYVCHLSLLWRCGWRSPPVKRMMKQT